MKSAILLVVLAFLATGGGCERTPPAGQLSKGGAPASGKATAPLAGNGGDPYASSTPVVQDPQAEAPIVLFLGDSLTAGLGLEESQAYPAVLQRRLEAAGYPHRVVNAGVSGDTSRGGLSRMDWLLRQHPAIILVALGANDALRGQNPEDTRGNLVAIIEKARGAGARVILAGGKLPTNLGAEYGDRFAKIFPELAKKYDLPLVPFLLRGVFMRRAMNQADGIHPTAEGARIIAENVWPVLEPLLKK